MAFENQKPIYGASDESSFILKYFEDFYFEVIKFKNMALGVADPYFDATDDVALTPAEKAARPPSPAISPDGMITKLCEMLKSQSIDASRYGGEFAEKYYNEAQFLMAALADEVFLQMEWSGKKYWESNLIELRLYNTHFAGETYFARLDEFLKIRDPSRADIAMVYLLTLGLGFKGKYRGSDDNGKLAQYKRELYIFINHRDPTLFNLSAHLAPEAYLQTMEEGKIQFLNDWRPWVIIFLSAFAAMIVISLIVWRMNTSNTNELMDSIFKYTKNS